MRGVTRFLLLLGALLGLASAAPPGLAGPPPLFRDLPGDSPPGQLRSRWITPYVRHVETFLGDGSTSRVTWFERDGRVAREVEGSAGADFVHVSGKERSTVHATRADWTVELPDAPAGTQTYLCAAGPRVLVRDMWTDDGRGRMEVFTDGATPTRIGPFLRYGAETVKTHEDGSLAVLVREDEATALPRVRAYAPGGRPTFEAALPGHALLIAVAPGGRGALVQGNDPNASSSEWSWVDAEGPTPVPDLGPNPHLLTWVPGTAQAIVASSVGDQRATFRLVDFGEGRVRWEARAPATTAAYRTDEQVAVEAGHVLLAGIECHLVDGVGHWRRSVHALELATGKTVASWRSPYRGPPGYTEPRFVRVADRLYLVTDEEFAPFPLDDMTSRRNGWQAGS